MYVEMASTMQQYCLKWKYHHNNLLQMFSQLLLNENFTDVMLACEGGRTLKAHKVVLSACSSYFEQLFLEFREKNPIVILKDVAFADVQALVEFMYKGEINVTHDQLPSLLRTAENLHVKGLAEVSGKADEVLHTPPLSSSGAASGGGNQHSSTPGTPSNSFQQQMDQQSDDSPPTKRRRGRPPLDSTTLQHSVFDQRSDIKMEDGSHMYGNQDGGMSQGETSEDSGAGSNAYVTLSTSGSGAGQLQGNGLEGILKMNDYLLTGTRQQFWDEASTKRVMEAVKNKEMEMKKAAEILGVSYGTLYGRYREVYGCLKHPHKDTWGSRSTQQYPEVLEKLRRNELDLTQASELLNIKVSALSSYLTNVNTTTACLTTPQRLDAVAAVAASASVAGSGGGDHASGATARRSLAPSPPPPPLQGADNDDDDDDDDDEDDNYDGVDHKPILAVGRESLPVCHNVKKGK